MRITMVGTGYVGLVTGTCLSNTGNQVTCLDIDPIKIEKLNQGISPIYEPGLDEMIKRNEAAGRLTFTTDKRQAYASAQIIFICVGTPGDEHGHADLKYVLAAAKDIGQAIQASPALKALETSDAKIIVIKSTVPVGTSAKVKQTIAQETQKTFHMVSNPEFLKEGAAVNDFNRPDRVVIGSDDPEVNEVMHQLYEPFVRQGNPIIGMDIVSAEMVKYAANTMLATKISFINEIANLCEAYDADIDQVRKGMCSDKRIGNQFLYPGLGYGGSCFPKDVLACISMGELAKTPTVLLDAVHAVNQNQRQVFIGKIDTHFDSLKNKRFAIWGIAFKPGTNDIRQAPSLTIIQHLLDQGATVAAHDPVAHEVCKRLPKIGSAITYHDQPMDALDDADALVICTDWDEFRNPDFTQMQKRMKTPVIFDGRNLYKPKQMKKFGFTYYCVGKKM